MGVALTAAATGHDYCPAAVVFEVSENNIPTGLVTDQNDGTDRHCECDVSSPSAVLPSAGAVTPMVCPVTRLPSKGQQVGNAAVGDDDDVASVATVTAIRSPERDILLVAEIDGAVAAVTRSHCNLGSIEHCLPVIQTIVDTPSHYLLCNRVSTIHINTSTHLGRR